MSGRTHPDNWIAAAQRGLFAFDWAHTRDRYEFEAWPGDPLHLNDIKDDVIRQAAERVRILVRFSQLRWIDWGEAGRLSFGAAL